MLCATKEELREISGYKRRKEIIAWLKEKRYPIAEYDKDGWPKVPRLFIDRRFQVVREGPKLRLA